MEEEEDLTVEEVDVNDVDETPQIIKTH